MNKIAFYIILMCLPMMTIGQNTKVTSAINFLKRSQLAKAKEAIDTATTHEQTKDKARTWFIRGVIYYVMDTITDPAVKSLIGEPLSIASASFVKSYELDPKFTSLDVEPILSATIGLQAVSARYFNAGVGYYQSQDFAKASACFENSFLTNQKANIVDTLGLYNAAMTAEKGDLTDKAQEFYEKLINFNLTENSKTTLDINRYAKSYSALALIYLKKYNDKAKAYAMIQKGRSMFPNSFDMLIDEVNFFIKTKEYDKASGALDQAIAKDPENANLYYVKANMANVNLTEELYAKDSVQYGKYFKSAEQAYKQAINVKSDYFDANFNLGALYVNKAVAIMYVANKLDVYDPKYPKEKEKADKILLVAIPILEKAHQLDPNNKDTLLTLKNIYSRLGETVKLKEINTKLEALK